MIAFAAAQDAEDKASSVNAVYLILCNAMLTDLPALCCKVCQQGYDDGMPSAHDLPEHKPVAKASGFETRQDHSTAVRPVNATEATLACLWVENCVWLADDGDANCTKQW